MILEGIYFSVKPQLSHSYQYYGLAMTRALGHKFLFQFGIIADPTIYTYNIHNQEKYDRYLVLCSDGVSDVASEQELSQLLNDYLSKGYCLSEVTQLLVKYSLERWLIKFPNSTIPSEITDNTSLLIVDLDQIH